MWIFGALPYWNHFQVTNSSLIWCTIPNQDQPRDATRREWQFEVVSTAKICKKTARIGTPVLYPIHQTYSKWWTCLVKPTQLSSCGKLPWLIGRFTRKFHGLAMLNYQRVNCWKPGIWKHGARIRNWSQWAGPLWDLWQSAQVVFFHGLRGFTVQVQPRWNRQVGSVFWIQLIPQTSWNALILARR